jgi:hypothetical protein
MCTNTTNATTSAMTRRATTIIATANQRCELLSIGAA